MQRPPTSCWHDLNPEMLNRYCLMEHNGTLGLRMFRSFLLDDEHRTSTGRRWSNSWYRTLVCFRRHESCSYAYTRGVDLYINADWKWEWDCAAHTSDRTRFTRTIAPASSAVRILAILYSKPVRWRFLFNFQHQNYQWNDIVDSD